MNKTVLGLIISKPSSAGVLRGIIETNPNLKASLVLVVDRGTFGNSFEFCHDHFEDVTYLRCIGDVTDRLPRVESHELLRHLMPNFEGISLWRNLTMALAWAQNMDSLIFWDDDQYPIAPSDGRDFFEPFLKPLDEGYDLTTCRVYGNRVATSREVKHCFDNKALAILEEALLLCNEVAYPGMFTDSDSVFVGMDREPTVPIFRFGNKLDMILGGSCANNLHSDLPPHHQILNFTGERFARGCDVFFSTAFRKMKLKLVDGVYFHDSFSAITYEKGMNWKTAKLLPMPPTPHETTIRMFRQVVKGWLAYAPLLMLLACPDDWKERLERVKSILRQLSPPYDEYSYCFEKFFERLPEDYRRYVDVLDAWPSFRTEIRNSLVSR